MQKENRGLCRAKIDYKRERLEKRRKLWIKKERSIAFANVFIANGTVTVRNASLTMPKAQSIRCRFAVN